MSITNYGELKSAVARFASLAGMGDYTSSVPDFIALAEADIRRDVRVLDMLKNVSGSLVSGSIPLPQRFNAVRGLRIDPYGTLDLIDPLQFSDLSMRTYPAGYSITGTSIDVAGAGTDAYILSFWQTYPALTADSDTNWLLTNAQDVYLFAALANGADFMKDDAGLTKWATRYERAVERVNSQCKAQLTGGPMKMRPRVVA